MISLEEVRQRAESDAKKNGYHLNPDQSFLRNLLEGLKVNYERYGYSSCPCRLASRKFEFDRDIVCPCDYRDPDVLEFGTCYCALYVRKDVFEGDSPIQPIPERRPAEKQIRAYETSTDTPQKPVQKITVTTMQPEDIRLKLWYCRQCGYVTYREDPPYICPICKAKKEIFSEMRFYHTK